MNLTREKILQALFTILQKIQESIVDEPERIAETTVPIGDLHNFDSLASVEATVAVLSTLGFKVEEFPSYPTLFINRSKEALSVGQIADRILKLDKMRS